MTKEIIRFINTELNIDITKKKKTNEYVFARTVYYKLCKELTNLPLEEIGSKVNKDHCSVLHNLKNFEQTMKIPKFKKLYFTFKEFPVEKDRYQYTEILKLNEQIRTELIDLKQKHRKLIEDIEEKNKIETSKVEQLLQGLTQEQIDLVHIRIEAMVKMIKTT
jgi:hypothetical protein